jgi:AcrR family transcriptional regulator
LVILLAAEELFLRHGFVATTMDEVAARAGVSKQTLYKHLADKQALFTEIVVGAVDAASDPVQRATLELRDSGDLEADLRELARRQLHLVMRPRLMQLRRLVIGDTARFPELGHAFYERGPARTIAALAASFERLAARGALRAGSPMVAATHFSWLIMSAPVNRAILLGEEGIPGPTELDRYADEGVRAFLAAYGAEG